MNISKNYRPYEYRFNDNCGCKEIMYNNNCSYLVKITLNVFVFYVLIKKSKCTLLILSITYVIKITK
jgi:hypothetical protein